jgi:MinD-like ATPase involved in chromosome partitioning or flagellar assembly
MKLLEPSALSMPANILNGQLRSLFITAPYEKIGCTTATVSLAHSLAHFVSEHILVIDGNNKSSNLSNQLGIGDQQGFCNLLNLADDFDIAFLTHQQPDYGFDVLPYGVDCHTKKTSCKYVGAVLDKLKEHYQYLLFDSPSIYLNYEVLVMAPMFDGVILVLESEKTRWEVAQTMTERLQHSGAKVAGAIFNRRKYYLPKWVYKLL